MQPIDIELFGRKLRIRGDNPAKVQEYADFLNAQLEELQSKVEFTDHTNLILFAALIITEKYFQERDMNSALAEEMNRLNDMIKAFVSEDPLS